MQQRSACSRLRAAFFDGLAHYGGQAFYLLIEGFAWCSGRVSLLHDERALRRAAHGYWTAKRLLRTQNPEAAFAVAREAFSRLHGTDRRQTFVEFGVLIAGFLDKVAQELGDPTAAYRELREVREVLRELQATRPGSRHLDGVVNWIELRLGEGTKTPSP
jgi:hypothetical protein